MKQLVRNNLQNLQAAHATQYQPTNKQPNQKVGKRPKQIFLQRRHTNGNKHKKMLNVTHCQRNANQDHNEVQFHTSQNGCDPKVYKQ